MAGVVKSKGIALPAINTSVVPASLAPGIYGAMAPTDSASVAIQPWRLWKIYQYARDTESDMIMASKRHQRRKACENKDKLTQEQAHARAMSASRRQGESIHAYRCPHCGHYHTGHLTAQQKTARRAKGWRP